MLTPLEALYRQIIDDQVELICRFNADFQLTFVNRAYSEFFHAAVDALVGKNVLDLILESQRPAFLKYIDSLTPPAPLVTVQQQVASPDYSVRWVEWSIRGYFDTTDRLREVMAVGRDITKRKRAENRLNFLLELVRTTNQAPDLNTALSKTLHLIGEQFGWVYGEVWLPNADTQMLHASRVYYAASQFIDRVQALRTETERMSLAPNVSVPGYVALSKSPCWFSDLDLLTKDDFLRLHEAQAAGLRAIIAVPVQVDEALVAVLLFAADRVVPPDDDMRELLVTAGAQLGVVFQRKQVRDTLHEMNALLEQRVQTRTAELKRVQGWYHALSSNLPNISAILFDHDYRYLLVESHDPLYTKEHMEGRTVFEVLPPATLDALLPYYTAALNGEHVRVERHTRGMIFDAQFVPVRDEDGAVYAGLLVARNITEEREAERQVRENEERLRMLFEHVPDGIIQITSEGVITDANPALTLMLGIPRDQLIGDNVRAVAQRLQAQRIANAPLRQNPQSHRSGEYTIQRIDGNHATLEVLIYPIKLDDQPMQLVIVHDITLHKKAEEDLRRAWQRERELHDLKSRFISTTSHEFRTPLATIQSAGDLLEAYYDRMSGQERLERFGRIREQIEHMTALLDDVLTIGRLEAQTLTLQLERIDLGVFLRKMAHEFQDLHTDHALNFTPAVECAPIQGDDRLLRQAVTNLLSNAFKYSPPDSTVHIELTCQGGSAYIAVQDHGIGIPSEDQVHLFEPFFRARNAGTITGTGLGLAIAKRAVEAHKGEIKFESTLDQGTTFLIRLPLVADSTVDEEKE